VKYPGRRTADKEASTPTRTLNQSSSAWRPTPRNAPSAAGGSFEGVLGSFGSSVSTPSKQKGTAEIGSVDQPTSAWKDRERNTSASDLAAGILPGSGGGPGWGKTGKWRSAAQQQEDEDALKVGDFGSLILDLLADRIPLADAASESDAVS
jgi:hypothetical protein